MKGTYYVAFDTREVPNAIVATRVTLEREIIRDLEASLPINLSEHPLYPLLESYVLRNPSKAGRK